MNPPQGLPVEADRQRLSIELTPGVAALLDYLNAVTGVPKSQLGLQSLLEALPAMVERADGIQKRHAALLQAAKSQTPSSNKGSKR